MCNQEFLYIQDIFVSPVSVCQAFDCIQIARFNYIQTQQTNISACGKGRRRNIIIIILLRFVCCCDCNDHAVRDSIHFETGGHTNHSKWWKLYVEMKLKTCFGAQQSQCFVVTCATTFIIYLFCCVAHTHHTVELKYNM